jgi:hypothetical protein
VTTPAPGQGPPSSGHWWRSTHHWTVIGSVTSVIGTLLVTVIGILALLVGVVTLWVSIPPKPAERAPGAHSSAVTGPTPEELPNNSNSGVMPSVPAGSATAVIAPPPVPAPLGVVIRPAYARPGQQVKMTGSGFTPGPVEVMYQFLLLNTGEAKEVALGWSTAGPDGSFEYVFPVPADSCSAEGQVIAYSTQNAALVAQSSFAITANC